MAGNANSGRKKTSIECDKYLKMQCKTSLNAIVEIRDNKDAPVSARLDAAKYLCDRYLGKPSQPISGEGGGPIKVEHDAKPKLISAINRLASRAGATEGDTKPK